MAGFGSPRENPDWYSKGASGFRGVQPAAQPEMTSSPWKPIADPNDPGGSEFNRRQRSAPIAAAQRPQSQAPQAPPAGPGMTNTSSPNPLVGKINARQMLDFEGDLGAKRAAQVAAGQIADSGAQAEKAALGGLRRRGVTGGGLEGNVVSSIAGDTQRAIAGSSANIGLQKEDMRMRLGGQIAGQALSSDAAQNDQRRLALQQYQAESDTRLREEQARRQALEDQISLFSRMSDLGSGGVFGGDSGYGGDTGSGVGMLGGRGGGW